MTRNCLARVNLSATRFLAFAVFAFAGCEKVALDRQMEELCKKDGGIRVYETVALPLNMFDKLGDPFPGWRARPREDRLGADYRFIEETTFLKNGDPLKGEGRLARISEKVIRKADGKLLGESVIYGRSGGDFIPYSHPSSNSCPVFHGASDTAIRSVFLRKVQ